jgi:hypothetical protein
MGYFIWSAKGVEHRGQNVHEMMMLSEAGTREVVNE